MHFRSVIISLDEERPLILFILNSCQHAYHALLIRPSLPCHPIKYCLWRCFFCHCGHGGSSRHRIRTCKTPWYLYPGRREQDKTTKRVRNQSFLSLINFYDFLLCIRFLKEYKSMNQEASGDASKYLANPINAYLLVKRLTSDWKKVEGVMSQNSGSSTYIPTFL